MIKLHTRLQLRKRNFTTFWEVLRWEILPSERFFATLICMILYHVLESSILITLPGYWESLLQQLNVFMAKSRLRENHQKLLKEKLATLKREVNLFISFRASAFLYSKSLFCQSSFKKTTPDYCTVLPTLDSNTFEISFFDSSSTNHDSLH